jgi:thiamine kinase-like enzyme
MQDLVQLRLSKHLPGQELLSLSPLHSSTNQVYLATTPSTKVIYRVFGELDLVDKTAEQANFDLVAAAGLGPRNLGREAEYRFEEYVPGRTLTRLELVSDAEALAPCIANFHTITASQGEPHLERANREWGRAFQAKAAHWNCEGDRKELLDEVLWLTTAEAVEEVSKLYPRSALVFSHNDLSYFNILKHEDHFTILDYEYADSSYAAVDLAYYLNEVLFDYTYPEYPGVRVCLEDDMTATQVQNFIEIYAEAGRLDAGQLAGEVAKCRAAVDFMGALWAANMAKEVDGEFDFLMYAKLRLVEYRRLRELVI